ncbi:MAG: hypothetical protein JW929_12155 [Anaerolineales bacterium]|nr:hypothetical protein [Anaerolineales bacterium]
MKVLILLQGTVLMHRSGLGRTREERVRQVIEADPSIYDWVSYVPIGHAAEKIRIWKIQGAEIGYLSPHRTAADVGIDAEVLQAHRFPAGQVFSRREGEGYPEVIERVRPDILVEDDRESIGGERGMVFPRVRQELRRRIKSIVVREFGGIDHLPDEIATLLFLPDDWGSEKPSAA